MTAAVACLAVGFVLWNRLSQAPAATARQAGSEQAAQAAIDSAIKTVDSQAPRSPIRTVNPEKRAVSSPTPVKKRVVQDNPVQKRRWKRSEIRRIVHRTHRTRLRVAQRQPSPQQKPKRVAAVSPRPTPAQWQAWGVYYESQGDYQRAATAYGNAYAEQPDTATGFAAGQAAESAGDVTQALVYYTQILKSASEKREPQKGTLLWSLENISA
jgi:hypothetical protein